MKKFALVAGIILFVCCLSIPVFAQSNDTGMGTGDNATMGNQSTMGTESNTSQMPGDNNTMNVPAPSSDNTSTMNETMMQDDLMKNYSFEQKGDFQKALQSKIDQLSNDIMTLKNASNLTGDQKKELKEKQSAVKKLSAEMSKVQSANQNNWDKVQKKTQDTIKSIDSKIMGMEQKNK